jgi:hypothetical protein
MSYTKFAFCATMMALLFLSSVHADELTVSVSEGNGANSITSTSNFGAAANNAVEQAITLTPKEDTAKNYLYAEGDYSTSRSVSGSNGGYCYSGFSVAGSNAKSYYDFGADGSNYAILTESLQTSGANSINAYGCAFSSYGYAVNSLSTTSDWGQAQASYFNYAYATPTYAYDYAVVGSASGNYASATSYSGNYDWGDYAYSSFYAASASSSNYPAMIWNVAQYASSGYTYAEAGTNSGNAWSTDGYTLQNSWASDYYGDYSYNYLYSPYGLTLATSSYQPNYAYSSGYEGGTFASGSAWLWGNPTYAYSVNYHSFSGLTKYDYDYYYGWNTLSQFAANNLTNSYAVNYRYT